MGRSERTGKGVEFETARTFEALRLARQEQRDRFLGLAQAAVPRQCGQIVYLIRLSNNCDPVGQQENDAQLERSS